MQVKNKHKYAHYSLVLIGLVVVLGLFAFQSFTKKDKKKEVLVVPKVEAKTGLSALQITLKEKHFLKLKDKRNLALANGILETSDDDYVPVIVTYDGVDFPADLRLKGDWTDHLAGDKWSYRIKLKNDQTIFGMRKFSIHHPITRGYANEWLYHKVNKAEGLMGLRYHFAEGFLHIKLKGSDRIINKDVGIYAIEETFDKRTIESNARKEGVILRISEEYFWKEIKQAWSIEKQTGYRPNDKRLPQFLGPGNEYVSTFGLSKILEDEGLHKQFIHAKNLLESYRVYALTTSEVFDAKKLALHVVLNNLFGGYHGLASINTRFYYNPTTSKLEPISYDANSGQKLKKFHHYPYTERNMDNLYRQELIAAIKRVSQPEYLDAIFDEYYNDARAFETILLTEFEKASIIDKTILQSNQEVLKQEQIRLENLIN